MLFLCSILCPMSSGEVSCCSVVCGTLVSVSVFSVMCSEFLIMSEIS